ncbi:MAG: polymer-forming cytoskeletal protein [Ferruginibacter sp.]
MFISKSKNSDNQPANVSTTLIGMGTVITGNIESGGDIRIDGILKGNLLAKAKVIIGADSIIEGDIICQQADVSGRVEGRLQVNDLLYLKGQAVVLGDIHSAKLLIEPTVSFNGQCRMGANIVELNTDIAKAVNE